MFRDRSGRELNGSFHHDFANLEQAEEEQKQQPENNVFNLEQPNILDEEEKDEPNEHKINNGEEDEDDDLQFPLDLQFAELIEITVTPISDEDKRNPDFIRARIEKWYHVSHALFFFFFIIVACHFHPCFYCHIHFCFFEYLFCSETGTEFGVDHSKFLRGKIPMVLMTKNCMVKMTI